MIIYLVFLFLLTSCLNNGSEMSSTAQGATVTNTPTLTAVSAPTFPPTPVPPTPIPSPTPLPAIELTYHRIQIEYLLTSDWGSLEITGIENALAVTVIEQTGTPNVSVTASQIDVNRPLADLKTQPEVRLLIEVALPADTSGMLKFLSQHGAINGSLTRVYLLPVDGEALLLREFDHRWVDPNNPDTSAARFTVDLSALQTAVPWKQSVSRSGIERLVWAIYYPWYMEEFGQRWWASDIWTDRPLEPWSSDDPAGLRAHIEQARSAGIDGFLVEWCGGPTLGDALIDRNFGTLLDLALELNFKIAAYYDLLCTGDEFRPADLEYLLTVHAAHPAYYHMNGLPVVVMYSTGSEDPSEWPGLLDGFRQRGLDAIFVGESYDPAQFAFFDGLHQYHNFYIADLPEVYRAVQQASLLQSLSAPAGRPRFWAATVAPGFDNTPLYNGRDTLAQGMTEQDITILDRADGQTYSNAWEMAIQSGAEWIIITSWNEWQENSHIEPSQYYGTQYLDLTRDFINAWKHNTP